MLNKLYVLLACMICFSNLFASSGNDTVSINKNCVVYLVENDSLKIQLLLKTFERSKNDCLIKLLNLEERKRMTSIVDMNLLDSLKEDHFYYEKFSAINKRLLLIMPLINKQENSIWLPAFSVRKRFLSRFLEDLRKKVKEEIFYGHYIPPSPKKDLKIGLVGILVLKQDTITFYQW